MSFKSSIISNFFLLSLNNIINNSFATFLLIIFVLDGQFKDATDIALIGAFTIFITKIFSLNLRNIYIAKNKEINLDNHIIIRLFVSIILTFLCFVFCYFFLKIENNILYLFILIFIFQWIIELSLVKFEINSSHNKIKFLFILNILIIIYISLSIFLLNNLLFEQTLMLYLFFLILIFVQSLNYRNVKLDKLFFKNLKNIFINTFNSFSFLSSFSLNFANLLWRILLTLFIGKALSSIIFLFYSMGSFPGTIFNVSFGPTMVKNKIKPKFLLLFFLFYFSLILVFLFCLYKYQLFYNFNENFSQSFLKNITVFSLIGSLIMLYALYFRQKVVNEYPIFNNKIFLKDVYVSIGIILVIPILYSLGGMDYLAFSYFFASIISIIVYYIGTK